MVGTRSLRALPVPAALALIVTMASPALAAPGDLDLTFSRNGKVRTGFDAGAAQANAVAIQADGKIVAAGGIPGALALVRYKHNGQLDVGFGGDGRVSADFGPGAGGGAEGVAIQADGKIVAAGSATSPAGSNDFGVARFNVDGSLDSSFGGDGTVTTDFNPSWASNDTGFDVAIQADGKIVVAGTTTNPSNIADFAVARYMADGTLDPTFGTGGEVITDFSGRNDVGYAVAIRADGKIVVDGYIRNVGPQYFDFALARYKPNGKLDTSFDGDGLVVTDFGDTDIALDVTVQLDGKVIAAGLHYDPASSYDFALARYNVDGSLDPSFDGDGMVTTDFGDFDEAFGVAVQADGRIVAAGVALGTVFGVDRYNSDGSLDTGFGNAGLVTTDFTAGATDVAVQPDGKIVAVGRTTKLSGDEVFAVARYQTA